MFVKPVTSAARVVSPVGSRIHHLALPVLDAPGVIRPANTFHLPEPVAGGISRQSASSDTITSGVATVPNPLPLMRSRPTSATKLKSVVFALLPSTFSISIVFGSAAEVLRLSTRNAKAIWIVVAVPASRLGRSR